MEVESVMLDSDDNCIKETFTKHPLSLDSSYKNNVFGDPLISPRVGNEYQVDIPPLITESDSFKQFIDSTNSEIPDTSEGKNIENERLGSVTNPDNGIDRSWSAESTNGKNNHNVPKKEELIGFVVEDGEVESRIERSKLMLVDKMNLNQLQRTKNCYPVPRLSNQPWTDDEVDSFVLALYVFGKDFVQIKRFMENKAMAEILSFYYGKFYRSAAYQRWSDSRKSKRKKCTTGRKIFTGWRQQKLLSRLSPHVSEECQNTLLEEYRSFADGRTSLEEYITSLKSVVSARVLVEAVAIGKGKEDLTGFAVEPRKIKHEFLICPKLPRGQACSFLTTTDIVKYLTGGFRLSKTQCDDIFWEAVWPRLLANGWNSEQSKSQAYVSSKYHLVYLMPGVQKFSRNKLVKGEHYFDCVSDVLSKVASEPKLIKLEGEDFPVGSDKEKEKFIAEDASDPDDIFAHQRHCYLKPRVSACDLSHMKFTVIDSTLFCGKSASIRELRSLPSEFVLSSEIDTAQMLFHHAKPKHDKVLCDKDGQHHTRFTIVDTSLVHRGKVAKMTELRYLPAEVNDASESTNPLITKEQSFNSHSSLGEAIGVPSNDKQNKDNCHKDTCEPVGMNQVETKNNSGTEPKTMENHQDQNTSMSDEKLPKRTILHQFCRRAKSGQSNYTGPLVKRRRLTACEKAETSLISEKYSQHLELKQTRQSETMNSSDEGKKILSQVGTQEKFSSTTSPVAGSPIKENNKVEFHRGNYFSVDVSQDITKKHQNEALANQNLTKYPLDSKNQRLLNVKTEGSQVINVDSFCFSSDENKLGSEDLRTITNDAGNPQKHHNISQRRQSTRKRPLTTRALEAIENGFLTDHRWQKGTEDRALEDPCESPSHKTRRRVKLTSNHDDAVTCIKAAKEDNGMNKACNVEGCITRLNLSAP